MAGLWTQYRDELASDPLLVLALTAALVALATTPLAFAVLGRLDWFKARRGRVLQRPEFSSIVVGMILVMGIPAIFAAMVLKSRSFDKNRYEFDPNKTWSVLEQGRGFQNSRRPTRPSSRRWSGWRWSGRTWSTTSRSWTSRCWRCGAWRDVAGGGAAVPAASCSRWPACGRASGWTARSNCWISPRRRSTCAPSPPAQRGPPRASSRTAAGATVAALPAPACDRRSGRRWAEPGPGRGRAGDRPRAPAPASPPCCRCRDLPPGWTVGKSGERAPRDVQRRQPLREDRRPRRELPPVWRQGDGLRLLPPDRRPVQRAPALRLRDGRFPQGPGQVRLGEARRVPGGRDRRPGVYHAPAARCSTPGKYYTQIVSTAGRPQVRRLRAGARQAGRRPPEAGRYRRQPARCRPRQRDRESGCRQPRRSRPLTPRSRPRPRSHRRRCSPCCRPRAGEGDPKYVAQDVFGYSFLSDVFMADYKDGDVTWQGFLRPYRDAARPRRSSRSTSRASRKTAPRSRRSRPTGPTRSSSAPISAWSTSSSARGTPWPGPTAPPAAPRPRPSPAPGQEPAGHASRPSGAVK